MQTVTGGRDLPIGPEASQAGPEGAPPIAEQLHQAKKLKGLEEEVAQLTNQNRQQMHVVSKVEESLRSCISESELRRAIGLAFQEFETRLADAFQDSNRKFLNLFAKKDEVAEVHGAVSKKVNWGAHQQVLGKLAELRAYLDTAGETVFAGHRDALHQEFARKADAATVDMALKSKADFAEMNDLRARLERLEMLLSHSGTHQSARLDELRDELNTKVNGHVKQLNNQLKDQGELINSALEHGKILDQQLNAAQSDLATQRKTISELNEVTSSAVNEATSSAVNAAGQGSTQRSIVDQLRDLNRNTEKLFGITKTHKGNHEETKSQIKEIKELIEGVNAIARKNRKVLDDAVAELKEVNRGSEQRFSAISSKEQIVERQLEFLMQASEASKRKVKEMNKNFGKTCTGLASDSERCASAVAECEAKIRLAEQRLKQIVEEGESCGSGRRDKSPPKSPNAHLAGVLEQLQAIVDDDIFVKKPAGATLPGLGATGGTKNSTATAGSAALSGSFRGGSGVDWTSTAASVAQASDQTYRQPVPPLPMSPPFSSPASARGPGPMPPSSSPGSARGAGYGGNVSRGRPRF